MATEHPTNQFFDMGVKWAVIDTKTNRALLMRDTEKEAEISLGVAFRGYPAGRIEQMGIRIKRVMVSLQVLPDGCTVPVHIQPALPLTH